jgi:uncharacterized protein YjbJ (UPF0337 family)
MDENREAGTVRNVGGKVEEGFGRVTRDTKTKAEGIANQAAGAAQDLYGQAQDSAVDAAGAARDSAASLENGCVIRSKPSHTLLPWLPLASAGCSDGCTGRCDWR